MGRENVIVSMGSLIMVLFLSNLVGIIVHTIGEERSPVAHPTTTDDDSLIYNEVFETTISTPAEVTDEIPVQPDLEEYGYVINGPPEMTPEDYFFNFILPQLMGQDTFVLEDPRIRGNQPQPRPRSITTTMLRKLLGGL